MYTHICSPELRISNSSRKLIQTVLTHSRANIYKLRRLLSSMLFELSDKILYRNGNSLINSYTEVFYNYGMPIEHIFKTNIDNSELFKNIYLLIFIDSGARYESMKLIMNIYDIIDTARFPRSNLFIIMSPQRFESVYARTLLFNITYNIFKSNFILSFSDDDLHIFLPSLYNFSMDFLNETKIIPLQFVYHPTSKRDVSIEDERVVLHTHFGRFLFPWKVFDLYPMTLDIGPKQREDLRFYIRAWINKAIVSDEVKPLIKYYYFGRTNNNYKLDDVIKPYIRDMMTIADIRIIYTQYRIKGDPRIQSINDLFKYHINVCSYKLKRVIQGDIDGIPLDPTNHLIIYTHILLDWY